MKKISGEALEMRGALEDWSEAKVKALLEGGYKVDQPIFGDTCEAALHHAARFGKSDMCKLLLDAGAKVDFKDKYGDTPLVAAIEGIDEGGVVIVDMLLAAGANVKNKSKKYETPLHRAASRSKFDPEVLRLLLDKGADLFAMTKGGRTPMHHTETLQAFRFFVDAGADWNYIPPGITTGYMTPFQHHVFMGRADIVRYCLDRGVDVGQRTLDGKTLLHLCDDSSEVRALLLSAKTEALISDVLTSSDKPAPAQKRGGMSPI